MTWSHAPFDVKGLAKLHARLGERRAHKKRAPHPTVIVNVPVDRTDEATVRANAWMLSAGAGHRCAWHSLCHADTRERFGRFRSSALSAASARHRRISERRTARRSRIRTAARIWGISTESIWTKRSVWPLNPMASTAWSEAGGQVRVAKRQETPRFQDRLAEWGPADMAISLHVAVDASHAQVMLDAAPKCLRMQANKLFFLNTVTQTTW